ncbi:MAG: DNA-formamidopyrimidine glycosylase [Erysipelotrichales bacterium]|nr:DNA-formamidopyrimidine glycosylase [Erysipelotrichales bacterium]
MPELPEVETVVRTLEKRLKGACVASCTVFYDKLVDDPDPRTFEEHLTGETFLRFSRRGKYILIQTGHYTWVSHMRMEGKFFVYPDASLRDKHTHMMISLEDGRYLYYKDTRKFGRMELYPAGERIRAIESLGLEPFDERLTPEYLKEKGRNRVLKEVLLDQTVIAGIGNIYANEIAFAIGRRPSARIAKMSKKSLADLIRETRRILTQAIEAGGNTIRSYNSEPGITGRFQLEVMVHGRENEPCKICGTPIKKIRYKGRGTYYCVRCQK